MHLAAPAPPRPAAAVPIRPRTRSTRARPASPADRRAPRSRRGRAGNTCPSGSGSQRRAPASAARRARQRLGVGHRVDALERHDRPSLLEPHRRRRRERLDAPVAPARTRTSAPARNRSSGKSVSGFTITCPRLPCGRATRPTSTRSSHARRVIRAPSRRGTRRVRLARPRAPRPRRPACARAAAVRPWRPITRPRSPGAMNSSTSAGPRCSLSVTRTASGWSASARATTSTTSRARLTTPAAPPRPPRSAGAGGIRVRATSVRTVSDGCAPTFTQWASRSRSSFSVSGLRPRVVVPEDSRRTCCRAPCRTRSPPRGRTAASSNPPAASELPTFLLLVQLGVDSAAPPLSSASAPPTRSSSAGARPCASACPCRLRRPPCRRAPSASSASA